MAEMNKEAIEGLIKELEVILADDAKLQEVIDSVMEDFDKNKDGKLQKEELGEFMATVYTEVKCPKPDIAIVDQTFKETDINDDKVLTGDEIKMVTKKMLEFTKTKFQEGL